MKLRRLLCALLAVCMLIPFNYVMPASADTDWEYKVTVTTATGGSDPHTKKGAIQVTLKFNGGDEGGKLDDGVNKKGADAKYSTKSSRAPWTLDSITLKNNTKDGYKIHRIRIEVSKSGKSKNILDWYPGNSNDTSSGEWIDKDNGRKESYTVYTGTKRKIYQAGNFYDEFGKDIFIEPMGESGNISHKWDCKISDSYADIMGSSYNCMEYPDAPEIEISVGGKKGDNSKITKSELEKNGFQFFNDKDSGFGYTANRLLVSQYMNKNNIYSIDIGFNIKFPPESTSMYGGIFYSGTSTVIHRNAFALESVNFSSNYYHAGTDNYFYNNSGDKKISVTANIKTTGSSSDYGSGALKDATLYFDKAYLKAGDNTVINAADSSGKPISSVKVDEGKSFKLEFPYTEGLDSQNAGVVLMFEKARLRYTPYTGEEEELIMWDENYNIPGFSNRSIGGYLMSTHKIDSQNPTVAVSPADGTDLNKWNKTVTLSAVPSEDIYLQTASGLTRGLLDMNLSDGTNAPAIYRFNYTEQNPGTASSMQKVPALKSLSQKITLALRDKVEGNFDLVFSGYDYAGNQLKTVYKGIKLDNKAPEVTVTEKANPKIDGKKGNIYNVKISDASGTGRLYYMFTKKNIADIPEYDGSGSLTSGDMDTTLDKWAYIEQKDTENGKTAAAYLEVEKGQTFIGHLVYFAVDEAGNKTNISVEDININNEDTAYDITPKNPAKPRSSYDISVTTNGNNKVYYSWKNYVKDEATGKMKENYIVKDKLYNGIIKTAKDEATKNLNGTYILECIIVPPSGKSIPCVPVSYAFDNEGPVINVTPAGGDTYKSSQTVTVYATDMSDIVSATAKIVTPDGRDIEGRGETALSIANGILSQNVNISDIAGGAYALKITATDTNGLSATEISKPFFIRNSKPTGTVDVSSSIRHNARALISDGKIKLDFDITEDFANSSAAGNQALYYSVSTTAGEYGEWLKAGAVKSNGNTLTANLTVDAPEIALTDGENTIFVQTAICHEDADKTKIDLTTVKNDEIVFYYDSSAPDATLVINDIHTTDSISGKIYVSDNLGAGVTAVCNDDTIKIGEFANGAFDITALKNTGKDTLITVSDKAGNKTYIKPVIRGIDVEAPEVEITSSERMSGERKDALATVKISGVLPETVKFAFIPQDKVSGGNIPEKYFKENLPDGDFYKVTQARTEDGEWDGEYNIIYNVEISGITDTRYLGVRSSDSLGNTNDVIFETPLVSQDAELTAVTTVTPKETAARTVARVSYNVPVYTLPQDKIVDENSDVVKNNTLEIDEDIWKTLSAAEKVEAANFELAKKYALSYSDKHTFSAGENKVYDLYTADDLGRTKHLTAEVSGVTFNAQSDIKAGVYFKEWPDPYTYNYIPVKNEEICAEIAQSSDDYYVIVEADGGDGNTLYLPEETSIIEAWYTNGLIFSEYSSKDYAVYSREPSEDDPYDNGEIKGYTKLVYSLKPIEIDDGSGYYRLSDVTERIINVRAFQRNADISDPGQVAERSVVLSGIDNDAPIIKWSVTPEVLTYETVDYGNGEFYTALVPHPTPEDVTYTLRAQDKESGIGKILAVVYMTPDGGYEEVYVPMTDENGNPTEYWSWDGNEHMGGVEEYDEENGAPVLAAKPIPVKIEYFGDGDIYGEKTLTYTFTDAYSLKKAGIFTNTCGADAYPGIYFRAGGDSGGSESGLSTVGIIYKMPIEEGKDYNVKYFFENSEGSWEEFTDIENTYYKNAKAVIEIPEGSRGEERALAVTNNNRSNEKILNSYQNEFTFNLKDKYNYRADVNVSLKNFDNEPGTVDYKLSTTSKTNKPVEVTVTVSDAKSGIGTVKLTSGADEVTLTKIEEYELGTEGTEKVKYAVYKGDISQNGTYSITLFDRVANKTVKSFNIKNINTVIPEATVTYSTEEYTSRPVNATVSFSKPNVKIVNIEPVAPLTAADYSVNYSTSVITFTKSGTVGVCYEDDYGNSNSDNPLIVAVKNIDKTPPVLEPVYDTTTDPSVVSVTFDKVDVLTSAMDLQRKESDIFVTYGGITKPVADEDGNKNSYTFYENGNYTFKVHDKEGLSSFVSINIDGIDKKAPKITSVKWSYDYDEFDGENWVTKTANGQKTPVDGTAGYIVGSDIHKITNKDVTVTVETDDDTRLIGSNDGYDKVKEKVYDRNGLFIFNTEKKNGLTASYGIDIEIIDKTAPVIDLSELGAELVFYENPQMNSDYDISMLKYVKDGKYTAYKAYDVFNGKKTDLTENVEIDWGGFNASDLSQNKFDSSKPYTVTYKVTDSAHNTMTAKRTIRLVGINDTVAFVNGSLPDFAGRSEVTGSSIKISLANFSGTAYVRYQSGVKTMGQMKKDGIMVSKNENGDFEVPDLSEGWYTFYVQTDKRDYFTLCVYLSN
ncbi:hypothetical protein [Acetivibrio sp. MSJd-27]|uniref:hypothetical protein n=1 Tax=Acetivibrio sp. MSJd-27 TaxID=2841523 RepID=UPI001C109EF5|nr:hypothetical protein [Acetivibrio sp. MSJd-27]MBU5450820.1 hypothetical protein [Acetivibrio sp. MSJd-27]